jgi:multisubunit Na+/H+ antiporter MnhB subunit
MFSSNKYDRPPRSDARASETLERVHRAAIIIAVFIVAIGFLAKWVGDDSPIVPLTVGAVIGAYIILRRIERRRERAESNGDSDQ